jgi:hypothetical protein
MNSRVNYRLVWFKPKGVHEFYAARVRVGPVGWPALLTAAPHGRARGFPALGRLLVRIVTRAAALAWAMVGPAGPVWPPLAFSIS